MRNETFLVARTCKFSRDAEMREQKRRFHR